MTTTTTSAEPLRETAPPLHSPPIKRRSADPTRVFIDKDRLARFWFLTAAAVIVGTAVERIHLARTLKERERVVIVDPAGTFFVSPLMQFQEARELHAQQSTLAAVAFLERNPKDFDHPELLKQMFPLNLFGHALAGELPDRSRNIWRCGHRNFLGSLRLTWMAGSPNE
jgi:hypothetical protein